MLFVVVRLNGQRTRLYERCIAPAAGAELWEKACEAYAESLVRKKDYHRVCMVPVLCRVWIGPRTPGSTI
jgi:hypothetical protein